MADMVESYVGAMFIDSNFNFAEVQRFFDTHVVWFFKDMSIYDNFANSHPIVCITCDWFCISVILTQA